MDLQKLTHYRSYSFTVAAAIGLSLLAVVAAAVIGRSALNLKGELVQEHVTVPVVIQLIGDAKPDEFISNVQELPVRQDVVGSAFVVTTDVSSYYVRVSPTKPWKLLETKVMHNDTL